MDPISKSCKVQVKGLSPKGLHGGPRRTQFGDLGGPFEIRLGSDRGLGDQEGIGKESGRAWVGPGAAGDPQMSATWTQLEPSWSQHGLNMGPT